MSEKEYILYHILSIIPEDLAFLVFPFLVCTHAGLPLSLSCLIITIIWIMVHPPRMAHILALRGLILYALLTLFGFLGIIFSVVIHGVWNWYFLGVRDGG